MQRRRAGTGSRVSPLSLLLVEYCERRDRNAYKGGVRRAIVRRLLCHGRGTAGWRFLALEAAAAGADDWFPRKEYRDLTTEAVAKRKPASTRSGEQSDRQLWAGASPESGGCKHQSSSHPASGRAAGIGQRPKDTRVSAPSPTV